MLSDAEIQAIISRVKGRVAAVEGREHPGPALNAAAEMADVTARLGDGIHPTIDAAVSAAKRASVTYRESGLGTRKTIVEAIREAMLREGERLAYLAREETGLGRAEDKVIKNRLVTTKTPGPEDLEPQAVTGDGGMMVTEYAPYGVIGSITPTTNPTSTIINNTIAMVSAGNAVTFNVHPSAKNVSVDVDVDLSDAENPAVVQLVANPRFTSAIALRAGRLYATADGAVRTLHIADGFDEIHASEVAGQTEEIAITDDLAVLTDGRRGLLTLDVSDSWSPQIIARQEIPGYSEGMDLSGGLAFIAAWEGGLIIVDVSDPATPQILSQSLVDGRAMDVAASDDVAVVTVSDSLYSGWIEVVDVSNPSSPTVASIIQASDRPLGVDCSQSHAYVVVGGGLLVVDIRDPYQAAEVAAIELSSPRAAYKIAISDDLAFVTSDSYGVYVVDISDPTQPAVLARYPVVSGYGVTVNGPRVVIANSVSRGRRGVTVIDVSNIDEPVFRFAASMRTNYYAALVDEVLYVPSAPFVETMTLECRRPRANFRWTAVGRTVWFEDSTEFSFDELEWDFGDGNTSDLRNPVHRYAVPGGYTVTLRATGEFGTDDVSRMVAAGRDPGTQAIRRSDSRRVHP